VIKLPDKKEWQEDLLYLKKNIKLSRESLDLININEVSKIERLLEDEENILLRKFKNLYQSLLDSLTAHIAVLDRTGIIRYTNQAWNKFASGNGLVSEQYGIGINYIAICKKAKGECSKEAYAAYRGIKNVINGKNDYFTLEYPCHSPDKKRWYEMRVTSFKGEGPYAVVISHEDITKRKLKELELKEEREKIKYLSFHDVMTSLYNRRYFENELDRLNQSRRLPISIIVADIDGLKYANDNYGHKMGDEFIKKAGEIIKSVLRDEDVLARIGGDEFAVILPETDNKLAESIIIRIKKALNEYNEKSDLPEAVKVSLGFSSKVDKEQNIDKIFNEADHEMYKNKKENRK